MRRSIFLTLFLFVQFAVFAQTASKINISGFGELSAIKDGENYTIQVGDYGTYSFQGSIDPLELSAFVTIDQLEKLPGYTVLENLGLQNISLYLSDEGFSFSAKADTKKKLEKICKLLKITTPYIQLSADVSRESLLLDGALEFSDGAVEFMKIAKTGTSVKFKAASISTKLEPGSVELSVSTVLLIKPTEFDPELESVYTFSYDVISQTLSGSGSMMSEWVNPLGTTQFLDDGAIVFSDAAVELGINAVTLAPVNLGLALDSAIIFNVDFGVAVTIDPVEKEVAFYGKRPKMNANDFTTFLQKGFGLNVPNVLPDIYYIDSANVLFAPNGGSVGEVEMDEGLALKGIIHIGDAIQGPLDFSFDMENEFILKMDLDYDYRKFVMNELKKVNALAPVANEILKTFQVRKLYVDMYANKDDLNFSGKAKCDYEIFGKSHTFEFKAALDAEVIKQQLLAEIQKAAGPEIAAVTEAISKALSHSTAIASKALGDATQLIGNAAKHTHSKGTCDNECVPNLARRMAQPVLNGSREALQTFYDGVIEHVANIEAEDAEETKKLRRQFIRPRWDALTNQLDADWNTIRADRTYVQYYLLPESATGGGNIFRSVIDERKKIYRDLENDLMSDMMNASYFPKRKSRSGLQPNVAFEWEEQDQGTYDGMFSDQETIKNEIAAGASFEAGDIVLMSENKKYILEFNDEGDLVLYKYLDIPLRIIDSQHATKFTYEPDGVFAFYDSEGKRVRSDYIGSIAGVNLLRLHNDGNLERVNEQTGRAISSGTGEKVYSNKALASDKKLGSGVILVSKNKKYSLEYMGGNLEIIKYGVDEIWSSNTGSKTSYSLIFQSDGNLVLTGAGARVIWASGSHGQGGEALILQDDGKLVIQSAGGKVIWKTTLPLEIKPFTFLKLKNKHKSGYLNIKEGPVRSTKIAPGSAVAQWMLEPVQGTSFFRIKNRQQGTYLHVENGKLECTEIGIGAHSAMWEMDQVEGTNYVRIKNRWKPDNYIHHEWDIVECATIEQGWQSAQWEVDYDVFVAPMTIKYNKSEGCGTLYRNDQVLKKYCGWRKTWHTILLMKSIAGNKILFYDKNAGTGEIYEVDFNGNMRFLMKHEGWFGWSKLTWEAGPGLIKFEQPSGYFEKYTCNNAGNIIPHSKK